MSGRTIRTLLTAICLVPSFAAVAVAVCWSGRTRTIAWRPLALAVCLFVLGLLAIVLATFVTARRDARAQAARS